MRPGNVYIEPEIFGAYLYSVIKHFTEFGQKKKFVIVLGHGGFDIKSAVVNVCDRLCREYNISVAAFHIAHILNKLGLVDTSKDRHAGMWETSIIMAIDPHPVGDLSIYREVDPKKYGAAGNPLEASPALGAKLLEKVISYIENLVKSSRIKECYYDWQ